MRLEISTLQLTKRYPLTISRGTAAGSTNLLVRVIHDGIDGIGEGAPFALGGGIADDVESARADLLRWKPFLESVAPWEMQRIEAILDETAGGRLARAALDLALHDWLGRRAGMPLYRLLGLAPNHIVPTSITVGINPPSIVRERIPELMARLAPRALKIKLGNPDGPEADREMMAAVREVTPAGVRIWVDANGGWDLATASQMLPWLAKLDVEYVEQPLPAGHEEALLALYREAPLPIFADESCRVSRDVPGLADRVHGINLKLMKAGGVREGLRVIHTARALGLSVMMGCMSESSLAIAASAHLSPLADFLDLDSHLNLLPDPFTGLLWEDGRVLPGDGHGLGIRTTVDAARAIG